MDVDQQEKYDKLLQEGRRRFLTELLRNIERLGDLLARVQSEPEHGESIFRIAHTLKGSAPVFGLDRIGRSAEQLLSLWPEAGGDGGAPAMSLAESLQKSGSLLLQLRMEHEIYVRENEAAGTEMMNRGMLRTEECRLLIIDDDEALRSYVAQRLQLDGYQVDDAADVATAKQLIRERKYDLITLDLMLLPQSGYEMFAFLKEDPSLKWLPLIVLSGRSDISDKVRCFQLGADDYVTKPFQYEELRARIYSLLLRAKSFEQLAFRDPLTGVYNRRYFDHQLDIEMQRAERGQTSLSIAFIDIDRFKSINDNFGHHVGDLVLQGLAFLLQQRLRATDLIARYGGEEFVIAMPGADAEQAASIVRGILDHTHRMPIAQNESQPLYITFSAGVSQWRAELSRDSLIHLADEAMYQAKQQGRNRVLIRGDEEGHDQTEVQQVVLKRLLIADDDTILRSILAAQLKRPDVEIVEASDGEEALKLLSEKKFDATILDGIMPKVDGFDVLRRLKSDDALKGHETKVLMLSGKKKEKDVVRGLRLGADDYMAKPFSLVELELRVKRLLGLE